MLTKATAIAAPTTESNLSSTADPPSPASGIASAHIPPSSTLPPSIRTTKPSASLASSDPVEVPTRPSAEIETQRSADQEHPATGKLIHSEHPKLDRKSSASPKAAFSNEEDTHSFTNAGGDQLFGLSTDETVDPNLSTASSIQPLKPSAHLESVQGGSGVDSNVENTIRFSTNDGSQKSGTRSGEATTQTIKTPRPSVGSGSVQGGSILHISESSASRTVIDGQHLPQADPVTQSAGALFDGLPEDGNGGIDSSIITQKSHDKTALTILSDGSIPTTNARGEIYTADQTSAPENRPTNPGAPLSANTLGAESAIVSSTPIPFLSTPYPTSLPSAPDSTPTPAVIMTFASSTFTANQASEFLINSQTLSPGKTITVDGTPISYEPHTTAVPVGTTTEAGGLGGLIMSGFGSGSARTTDTAGTSTSSGNSTGNTGAVLTGGAMRGVVGGWGKVVWCVMGIVAFVGFRVT